MRVPLAWLYCLVLERLKYHYCVTSGKFICSFYNGDNIDGCISSHC